MNFKQKIYQHYQELIRLREISLLQSLADLKESGANETKSTAGDKHETALAMLQIEQANTRAQLQELLLQKAAFEKLNPTASTAAIHNGSLIKTNRGYFYLSVALGKALIEHLPVIAVSPQSPLAQKLLGKNVGDEVDMNGVMYRVEGVE